MIFDFEELNLELERYRGKKIISCKVTGEYQIEDFIHEKSNRYVEITDISLTGIVQIEIARKDGWVVPWADDSKEIQVTKTTEIEIEVQGATDAEDMLLALIERALLDRGDFKDAEEYILENE